MTSKRALSFLLVGSILFFQAPGTVRASHDAPPASNMTSAQVLSGLQEGNSRFVSGHPQAADLVAQRQKLVNGQAPNTIVLSCSDSRVPPELIFDQGLGELFVIRVAGNGINSAGVASIEYAVAHFKPKLLVVLGHTYCGAVKAALSTPSGQSAGSTDLDQLVSAIQENLKNKIYPSPKESPAMTEAVNAQVQAVEKQLPDRSSIVHDAVQKGELQIVGGVYDLSTGQVKFDR